MKKIRYILFLIISLVLIPVVYAKENVSIESYELVENSKTTTELSKPKINGLDIAFDLSFTKKDDYAKYKIVINNPTNKDYELSKDFEFNGSDYIKYEFKFEKEGNIVPAKSKLTMYITITYANEVPKNKLVNGKFTENNKMAISLAYASSASKTEEVNPKTGNNILVASVLILTISGISILFLKSKNRKRLTFILLLTMALIPVTKYAIEKLQINVETKVTIEEKYKVIYVYRTAVKESEKDNYNYEPDLYDDWEYGDACDSTKYIINGETYLECSVYTYSQYGAGSKINVEIIPFKAIVVEEAGNNGQWQHICQESQVGSSEAYICPESSYRDDYYDLMEYTRERNKTHRDDDPDVMKFKTVDENRWNGDQYGNKYIAFSAPNEFTMPAHDVIIYAHKPYL